MHLIASPTSFHSSIFTSIKFSKTPSGFICIVFLSASFQVMWMWMWLKALNYHSLAAPWQPPVGFSAHLSCTIKHTGLNSFWGGFAALFSLAKNFPVICRRLGIKPACCACSGCPCRIHPSERTGMFHFSNIAWYKILAVEFKESVPQTCQSKFQFITSIIPGCTQSSNL